MSKYNDSVYLCHKCSGLLAGQSKVLHGCGCISGWVRDWQEPVSERKAMQIQHDQDINNAKWLYKRNEPGDQEKVKCYLKRADEMLELLTAPDLAPNEVGTYLDSRCVDAGLGR